MNTRVVCAANRYEIDGETFLIIGARHFDSLMIAQIQRLPKQDKLLKSTECQGFIDQRGNFLSRTEAWKIAEQNGQIIRRVGGDSIDSGTLYSENLY